MTPSMLLQVQAEPDGGWSVRVSGLGERSAHGRLPAEQVGAVRGAVQAALEPAGVLLPDEVEVRAGEEAAGRALALVLQCSPAVIARVGEARGAAAAVGQPLVIGLDAQDPATWALPWELLALDEVPAEPEGRAMVVRLGPPGPAAAPGGSLRPLLWASDPDDLEVGALCAAVRTACEAAGLPAPERAETARLAAHEAAVLFVVSHGEGEEDLVRFLGPEGDLGGGAIGQALARLLPATVLCTVLVCDGDQRPARHAEALAERLLRGGARACLATGHRLPVQVAQDLTAALLDALGQGRGLVPALLHARAAVAALADPAPEARWWRLAISTGALDAVQWAPGPRLPSGWQPGPEARSLLLRALDHARRRQHRWLGCEHLVLAFLDDGQGLPASLLMPLHAEGAAVERFLARFRSRLDQPLLPSPRLDAVVTGLPAGFGVADLAHALVDAYPPRVRQVLGLLPDDGGIATRTDLRTLEALEPLVAPPAEPGAPASEHWRWVEVCGGPEDGRRVVLEPGDSLGRGFPRALATCRLYDRSSALDQALSSLHLGRRPDGALELAHRGWRRLSASGVLPLDEASVVRVGPDELLGLTKATWIWTVPMGVEEGGDDPSR